METFRTYAGFATAVANNEGRCPNLNHPQGNKCVVLYHRLGEYNLCNPTTCPVLADIKREERYDKKEN